MPTYRDLTGLLPPIAVKELTAAAAHRYAVIASTSDFATTWLTEDEIDAIVMPGPEEAAIAFRTPPGWYAGIAEAHLVLLDWEVLVLVILTAPDQFHAALTTSSTVAADLIRGHVRSHTDVTWRRVR
jgi:hypothetical protein